ncbi:maturation protein [ssRNA phage Zoerhiza.2_6]|uniref:Maturation protein n=2 Tax=Leviviricetes TaxID=2842243 RepID=A0A8S5L431_9VIRU|nr:maturation protein [ssRNA phage Zoerhiza.2_6]QDH86955.1 MAG: hypothetical protein H2Rhizo31527_000003 [Leviviridae sp.]DAD52172.1 TPA_asm: maturation protein [ssRNA phage Zoerhiza.2_6]
MFIERGKTKSRTIPGPTFFVKTVATSLDPANQVRIQASVPFNGTQVTESDGNRWPPPKGGDLHDYGSEFYSQKREVLPAKLAYTKLYFKRTPSSSISQDFTVEGNFLVANAWGTNGQLFGDSQDKNLNATDGRLLLPLPFVDESSSRLNLNAKGALAVAACAPTNKIAQAATAIGELLQDIPKIPGHSLLNKRITAVTTLASGAEEFLNYQFGIVPTISDAKSLYKGIHAVDKAIDQFVRDSGRVVRRSFHFPTERTESDTVVTGASPVGYAAGSRSNNLYVQPGFCLPSYETRRHRVTERKIWFSGAFTYHLPDWFDTKDRKDRIRLMAKLLGAEPDLETLWNLMPWSWAVDWFWNAGNYVKSLQSLITYGTVLRYGYVMETTTTTDTYYAGNRITDPDPAYKDAFKAPYPAIHPITLRTTTKKRVKANPFGFGLSWDGMSTTQQAIAAALGITRVVR